MQFQEVESLIALPTIIIFYLFIYLVFFANSKEWTVK